MQCRFVWQVWGFVTSQHVSLRVESRSVWQPSYFCEDFRRGLSVFVPDLHVYFAWHAQHFRHVVLRVFLRIALSGLRQVVTACISQSYFAWQAQHLVKIPFCVEISSAFGFLGWSCFNDKTTGSSLSLGALVALHSDDHCKYL